MTEGKMYHGGVENGALRSYCSQFPRVPCCWQGRSGQDDLPDYVYEGVLPPLPTCAPSVPPAQQASHLCGWPLATCRYVWGNTEGGMKVLSMLSDIACATAQSLHQVERVQDLCSEPRAQARASQSKLVSA